MVQSNHSLPAGYAMGGTLDAIRVPPSLRTSSAANVVQPSDRETGDGNWCVIVTYAALP